MIDLQLPRTSQVMTKSTSQVRHKYVTNDKQPTSLLLMQGLMLMYWCSCMMLVYVCSCMFAHVLMLMYDAHVCKLMHDAHVWCSCIDVHVWCSCIDAHVLMLIYWTTALLLIQVLMLIYLTAWAHSSSRHKLTSGCRQSYLGWRPLFVQLSYYSFSKVCRSYEERNLCGKGWWKGLP
jgi:hypothetical protein